MRNESDNLLDSPLLSRAANCPDQIEDPFPSNEIALAHLAGSVACPDAATLNVGLQDGNSYPVADQLKQLGVPFLFASANEATPLPSRFARAPLVTKPFTVYQIGLALTSLLKGDRAPAESLP